MNDEIIKAKKPIKIEKGKRPIIKQKKKGLNKVYIKILLVISIITVVVVPICFFYKPSIEKVKQSVVKIEVYDVHDDLISTGSGFCAYDKHFIVTNYHVIDGAYKIKIVCDDNSRKMVDKIVIFNINDDLAILETSYEFKPLKIGNSNRLKVGEKITTIGSPEGQLNVVSTGIISNTGNDNQIMITAPISPGSSGGVLLNFKNKVIGITNATYASSESQNLNYAIDVNVLNNLYKKYKEADYEVLNSSSIVPKDTFNKKCYRANGMLYFYEHTNERCLFEKSLSSNWKSIYNGFSEEQKKEIINLIKELGKYKYQNINIPTDIRKWNTTEFFLNLDVLEEYQYAMAITELESCTSRDEQFEIINSYPLKAAQKALILCLLGDYNWNELSFDNKEDIFIYFDSKYGTKDLGAILEMLGYTIEYKDNGTLTAWW